MSFFDWFKLRKPADQALELEPVTQEEFDSALMALVQHDTLETEEVIAEMIRHGIREDKATELYLFVPVAFCRRFIPDADYLDEYVDYYGERKQLIRSFKANQFYSQIVAYTEAYFNHNPQQKVVLNVAGVSAEFHAMNSLLSANNKASIKEIQFVPLYIIR
jgi:hypothetical protein